jgi:hypothetical protein
MPAAPPATAPPRAVAFTRWLLPLAVLLSVVTAAAWPSGDQKGSDLQRFEGIYEPSAVQQLPDGRVVLLEDEIEDAVSLLSPQLTLVPGAAPLDCVSLFADHPEPATRLDDLEAVAVGRGGHVYLMTSHSRNKAGAVDPHRELLVRMTPTADGLDGPVVFRGLKAAAAAQHPRLRPSLEVLKVKRDGGFNLEGMGFDAARQRLWFGLRSPLIDGFAALFVLENPDAVFESGAPPRIAPDLFLLDLGGGGVRGMSWVPQLDGYLLLAGPAGRGADELWGLWLWDGTAAPARRVTIPGGPPLVRAEGITPWSDGKERGVLIVYDDGDKSRQEGAHHLLLRYDQLDIAPR